jgi:hypothetical protein
MFKRLLLISLAALLSCLPYSVFAVPPNTLEWTYVFTPGAPPLYFEIWRSTDLEHWTLEGTTDRLYFIFQTSPHTLFFRCRAVESTPGGLASDWSNIAGTNLTIEEGQALDTLIDVITR